MHPWIQLLFWFFVSDIFFCMEDITNVLEVEKTSNVKSMLDLYWTCFQINELQNLSILELHSMIIHI
jgi:hypothetical protein